MQSGVVENWALSVDQCQLQVLQFSVPLIHFLSILLRCNGFTGIRKAMGFSNGTSDNLPANAGDLRDPGSIPGSGRSSGGGPGKHPSILAWRIQWTEESGVLQCMESQRVRHDWSNLARTQKAIVDETGSMSPNHDLFLVYVCFGKYFGASSWSNHWARHHWLSYKNPFSLHVTIEMRNGSLLLHRIREDTSKRRHFWFVVSYWGTHLLSFFTFPICFKCQMTLECLKLSSWTTSHVVLRE